MTVSSVTLGRDFPRTADHGAHAVIRRSKFSNPALFLASGLTLSGDLEHRAATCGHPARAVWAAQLGRAIEVACSAEGEAGVRIGAVRPCIKSVQGRFRVRLA